MGAYYRATFAPADSMVDGSCSRLAQSFCLCFFQSEINTSVHHSYATLDKRTEAMSQKVQLHGR